MAAPRPTAPDPFARALEILGRRDHSAAELREKLARAGFAAAEIEAAIERCVSSDYLDDRRFALTRCRELLRSGRGVGRKVLLDLRRRGISETLARRALAEAEREYAPERVLRDSLERRFPGFDYAAASAKERRRVIGYFQRRGFPLAVILAELR